MTLEHVSHGSGVNRHICISKPLSNTNSPSSEFEINTEGSYSSIIYTCDDHL